MADFLTRLFLVYGFSSIKLSEESTDQIILYYIQRVDPQNVFSVLVEGEFVTTVLYYV